MSCSYFVSSTVLSRLGTSTIRFKIGSTKSLSSWSTQIKNMEEILVDKSSRPAWSDEWKQLGLGAELVSGTFPRNLFFVQVGMGVDQHGQDNEATKAAVRAVRNAIEFNSIPGVITHLPG